MAYGTDRGGQPPGALGAGGNLQPPAQEDYRPQLRWIDGARPSDALRKTESALTRFAAAPCMKTAGCRIVRVFTILNLRRSYGRLNNDFSVHLFESLNGEKSRIVQVRNCKK